MGRCVASHVMSREAKGSEKKSYGTNGNGTRNVRRRKHRHRYRQTRSGSDSDPSTRTARQTQTQTHTHTHLGQQRHPENPAEVEEKDVGVGTCRQVYVALLAYNHICVCCFACRYTEK